MLSKLSVCSCSLAIHCECFQKMRGVILGESEAESLVTVFCVGNFAQGINWMGAVVDGLKADVSVCSLSFFVFNRLLSLLRLFPAPLEWITREWNLLPNYSCHSQIL